MDKALSEVVKSLASQTCNFSDQELEREWSWGDYEEGLRLAFFRTYEELNGLCATLESQRGFSTAPQTTIQRILAQYHAAYRDLQAVLLGIDDLTAERIPAEGEWPLRRVLVHIIQAERNFLAINHHALQRAHDRPDLPEEMSEELYDEFWAGDPFKALRESAPLSELMAYYESLHASVLHEFEDLSDSELQTPAVYWESVPMPLQFRLLRFDSHLRQHTVQMEKTLDMLGIHPQETRRLLRLVYGALARAEGALIGRPAAENQILNEVAEQIQHFTQEILQVASDH